MNLVFEGNVHYDDDEVSPTICIGKKNVADEVAAAFGRDVKIAVTLQEWSAEGNLYSSYSSSGYSEYTPGDYGALMVGSNNILERLMALDGQNVRLVLDDQNLGAMTLPTPEAVIKKVRG